MDDYIKNESTKILKLPKLVHYSYSPTFNLTLLKHVGETTSFCMAQNRMHSAGINKKSCY